MPMTQFEKKQEFALFFKRKECDRPNLDRKKCYVAVEMNKLCHAGKNLPGWA
jgi:hypothetical protein